MKLVVGSVYQLGVKETHQMVMVQRTWMETKNKGDVNGSTLNISTAGASALMNRSNSTNGTANSTNLTQRLYIDVLPCNLLILAQLPNQWQFLSQ